MCAAAVKKNGKWVRCSKRPHYWRTEPNWDNKPSTVDRYYVCWQHSNCELFTAAEEVNA